MLRTYTERKYAQLLRDPTLSPLHKAYIKLLIQRYPYMRRWDWAWKLTDVTKYLSEECNICMRYHWFFWKCECCNNLVCVHCRDTMLEKNMQSCPYCRQMTVCSRKRTQAP